MTKKNIFNQTKMNENDRKKGALVDPKRPLKTCSNCCF